MKTAEILLRRLIEHPRRGLFVIILTCLLGLLTVWPVVDEYCVLADDCAQLELSILEAQQEVAGSLQLRALAQRRADELAALRLKMLVQENVHSFSSKLVEMTRNAGCQLRRVDLGNVQKRRWYEDDHPLRAAPSPAKETPYELHTQRVLLSVSGPLERVQALLGELQRLDKLAHTHGLQLKPADDQRREVSLELDLLFFDLKRIKKPAAS